MNIAVIQLKGGVGKTPLSFSIAKDLGLKWQSNDDSVVPQIYNQAKVMDICKYEPNTVYDFGGHAAPGILNILKQCDVVIVPITPNPNTIKRAVTTINQIRPVTKKLLALLTEINTQKELNDLVSTLDVIKIPINKRMVLKNSKIFTNAIYKGKSFIELYKENGLTKNQYQTFIEMYTRILKYLKGELQ